MLKLSSKRLISAVKFIKAELRIDQLSDLKFSMDTIIALGMYVFTSCLRNASEKMTFMMLKEWILLSSFWSATSN